MSSASLAQRLASGDEAAIHEIYAAHGRAILSYLRRAVGPADAEDVLQTVFYEAWRSATTTLDPTRRLDAWLFGIARNRAIDHLRRRRGTAPLEAVPETVGQDGRDLAEQYAQAERVRRALDTLSPEQRQVLELAFFADLTQTEIARRLAVPLGTVKARVFRGLRRLADTIGADQ
jgi:RNA polymerase sigma-70 factor (ECF subfamily)